ncbi:hypothetical protein TREMEDRAFT_74394 [Tremella mesenterica DSM 1558]|uniref:uncharacterized protein n=1 Tax=Tremella mesenterica (strain ATCC 24925 / CBS 8224 / DSM 1558 / NBRC 9311 / NRRL Y-6157 / RJB 2259-6 / UBC 559-6) TaxID=578456 RepID=UPI0003F49D85|nr:uncharacterized protein TREMEDRAFT_74394 [Tremella mesenterica DSM 1558]EIW68063.1 hypothetical protein TREMEDRAFT_74394 [Tremella mesenterica DSM 1558]
MSLLESRLEKLLNQRKGKGRFRSLKVYPTDSLLDFSSNDYLSLTSSPNLRTSYLNTLSSSPNIFGSTGSRLLSGCTPSHLALESRLQSHFDAPSALLFNSGWDANVSFFATVPQKDDWVIYDELVHASVHSGLRASRVEEERRRSMKHRDVEDFRSVLEEILKDEETLSNSTSLEEGFHLDEGQKEGGGRIKMIERDVLRTDGGGGTIFLALESLYSMDGDFCPLLKMLEVFDNLVPSYRQCVVLDEAHSTGVYGKGGRGLAYSLGVHKRIVRLMTFGKAVGCSGAVLLGPETIRTFLINFARPLIFSTALPHSTVIALECAWDLLQSSEGDERRRRLFALIQHFHKLLNELLSKTPSNVLRLPYPSTSQQSSQDNDETSFISTLSPHAPPKSPIPPSNHLLSQPAQPSQPSLSLSGSTSLSISLPASSSQPSTTSEQTSSSSSWEAASSSSIQTLTTHKWISPPVDAPSAICGLLTPHPHRLSAFLLEKGMIIRPVVPPSVPPGGERIRICLRADMSSRDVERLVTCLKEWVDIEVRHGNSDIPSKGFGVKAKL